jgi:hypothetical protein
VGCEPLRVDIHLVIFLLYLVAKPGQKVPPPVLAHALWLSGEGIELIDQRHPILSLCVGWGRL